MARVPYSPSSSVSAQTVSVQGPQVRAIPDAFGAGVAQANQGLGRQLEATGDEIFKRAMDMQALANDSAAKEADAAFVMKMGDMHAEYQSLQGQAAVDGRQTYIENLKKLRDEVGKDLNPAAKKIYDSSTRQQFARAVFNSAGHAATELRRSAKGAAMAQIEANQMDAGVFPTDDLAFERGRQQNVRNIRETLAPLNGMSKEETDLAIRKSDSGMVASRIIGLANNDPFKAQEQLTKYKSALTPADLERAEKMVDSKVSTLGAREIDKQINADLFDKPATGTPEKGLDERVQEADALAKKLAPDNKLLQDAAVARVRATYVGRKRDAKDTYDFNRLNVASAINGDFGKVPTTVEELRAVSPAIAKSYDDLPSDKKGPFLRALANNAKGDVPETEANYRKYVELRGQATSTDPEERLKFLDSNIVELELPRKWRNGLLKMQESLVRSSEADPRVTRAMRQLQDAGIAPRAVTSNDPNINQYRGALQMALEDYQEQYKKAPDSKAIQEIGVRLSNEIKDPNSWSLFNPTTWSSGGAKNNFYKMEPNAETIAKIKADPRWKKLGVEPPEDLIRKYYLRERWQELYKGSSKAEQEELAKLKAGPQVPKSE